MTSQNSSLHHRSSPEAKIALFRALFRGREDVYPRRFESRKTGKSGYSPACANEWVRGVCEKPRVKCAACPHRRFLPVTDEVIRWHLAGRDDDGRDFVMGVYPMLQDETCFFLAADFEISIDIIPIMNYWFDPGRKLAIYPRQSLDNALNNLLWRWINSSTISRRQEPDPNFPGRLRSTQELISSRPKALPLSA